MERRKSIARRRPVIVYRVECVEHDGQEMLRVAAWSADELTGRIVGPMRYENWWTFEGDRIRGQWFDNRDTEVIHALDSDLRDLVWAVDDALRE